MIMTKRLIALFWKLFLRSAIPFGSIMGCYFSFLYGISAALFIGMIEGFLFGVTVASIVTLAEYVTIRKLRIDPVERALGFHQVHSFFFR